MTARIDLNLLSAANAVQFKFVVLLETCLAEVFRTPIIIFLAIDLDFIQIAIGYATNVALQM